jgi:hypothetical protein
MNGKLPLKPIKDTDTARSPTGDAMVKGQSPAETGPPFWLPEPLTRGRQHDMYLTGVHDVAIGCPQSGASRRGWWLKKLNVKMNDFEK